MKRTGTSRQHGGEVSEEDGKGDRDVFFTACRSYEEAKSTRAWSPLDLAAAQFMPSSLRREVALLLVVNRRLRLIGKCRVISAPTMAQCAEAKDSPTTTTARDDRD